MKNSTKLRHRKIMFMAFLIVFIAPIIVQQAQAKATQRPIEEFIDRQGTFCLSNDLTFGVYEDPCPANTGLLFVPPVKNFIGWNDPVLNLCTSIDYAGLANHYIKTEDPSSDLSTTFQGSITERPLADGRAQVIVNLRTYNALTWVIDGCDDFATNPLLLGHRAPDVLYGEEPALCNSHLQVKFINTAPGAPLPSLLQLQFFPEIGQEILSLAMRCNAEGPLHDEVDGVEENGTPGRAIVTQTGLFMTGFHGAVSDGFPVERIDLKVIGKKAKD